MIFIKIPMDNWHIHLADAIENAESNHVIMCHSEAMRELGFIAAKRMGKVVRFQVMSESEIDDELDKIF